MRATPNNILQIIERLDWSGHVEISYNDMAWLATEIAVALNPDNGEMCGNCELPKPFVIETALGPICEDCLDDMQHSAEAIRDTMED